MTREHDDDCERDDRRATGYGRLRRLGVRTGLVAALGSLALATPAAAAGSAICSESKFLPGLIESVIQLCVYGGVAGMILTYAATNVGESLPTVGQEQEQQLKQMRGKALSAGTKVILVGPVAAILKATTDIPLAQCIDFVPFV